MRWCVTLALIVILIGTLLLVPACGAGDKDHSTEGDKDHSTAYKLAVVDGKLPAGDDDPSLDPYRRHLETLRVNCLDSEERLGEMTYKAQRVLRRETGVRYSLLDLLEGAAILAPAAKAPEGPRDDCAAIFALMVVNLRESG
jgi:hypothetical protein